MDQPKRPVSVHLFAQASHLDVDHVVDGRGTPRFFPNVSGKHFPRDVMALVTQKIFEQVELPAGQVEHPLAKRGAEKLWTLLNVKLRPSESTRVFPLSNWTEIDVWNYIHLENIPIVPMYYAKEREVIVRGNSLIVQEQPFVVTMPGEKPQLVKCRMRSLGCSPCTGAIHSDADTIPKIINELIATKQSERLLRIIDHDQDGSMEVKKREGYF